MYSLPLRRLKDILSHVIPEATLVSVDDLKTTQLARLYILNMSDDRKLLLSCAPSLTTRLLRHEGTMMTTEAALIHFIAESGSGSTRHQKTGSSSSVVETERISELPDMSELVPKLLKHSANNREMAYPYSIFEPTPGSPLSTQSMYLSIPVRRIIDAKIGSIARSLANLISPISLFGPVSQVLGDPFTAPVPGAASIKSTGSKTWSEAFNILLEMILRDGEDMAVSLPYDEIRGHYKKQKRKLDAITTPRLSILDIGTESNVMIERILDLDSSIPPESCVKITGLRSWSGGIFGDPLISSCFDGPGEGFLEAWRVGGQDIVEDQENAEGRMLLYSCYRAVVAIVTEYYRPKGDSSRMELAGRRKLTDALKGLEVIDNDGDGGGERIEVLKRPRSLESDREEVKRQRM